MSRVIAVKTSVLFYLVRFLIELMRVVINGTTQDKPTRFA